MLHHMDGPPTVAAKAGREAAKMLQRFHALDTDGRAQLLKDALDMIERRRAAQLPPDRREAGRLIEQIAFRIERIAELKAAGKASAFDLRLNRELIADDRRRLQALGISYFGEPAHG